MADDQYNETTMELTLKVLTDKDFDCNELMSEDVSIDWSPVAQALCRRYFFRFDGYRKGLPCVEIAGRRIEHLFLDRSKECDWLKVFEAVAGRCERLGNCDVKLPMHATHVYSAKQPSDYDRASNCWRDDDAGIIRILLGKDAKLMDMGEEIPEAWRIPKEAVLNWCSEPVCDLVFGHMGWSYSDVDYSKCDWVGAIRTTGNRHTFEIVREYAADELDVGAFNLNDLFKERRIEIFQAVLEASEDGSVKSPKAKAFILAFAEEGKVALVDLSLKKFKLSKGAIQDILTTISEKSDKNDADHAILAAFDSVPKGKAKKPTMTECYKSAQIGAETANVQLLNELEPYASKMKPNKVVDLLERAAAYGDKATIGAVFKLFGKPESLASALCVAIRNGNEETARALRAKGASLIASGRQWSYDRKYARGFDLEEDIFVVSALSGYRIGQFFSFAAPEAHPEDVDYLPYKAESPGEYCHKDKAFALVRKLFENGQLKKCDVGALGFKMLDGCDDTRLAIEMFEQGTPESKRSEMLSQKIGTTIDKGFDDVADYVYQNVAPGDLVERFKAVRGYLTAQNHDALARCVRHLPADAVKPTDAMWKALAESGYFDELIIACNWEQCTPSDLEVALATAAEFGKPGATAVILEKQAAEGNDREMKPLEL